MQSFLCAAARLAKRPVLIAALASVLVLAGCKTEVYRGLSETQANAMVALLMKNGIQPEKTSEKDGYTISVERSRVSQTLELMRENSLPRADYENMGQIFAAKGMISSATEERARMTYALGQELSETLSQIDGVLTARVHVVLENRDLATGKTTPASAAVFLRYMPDSQVPNFVPNIRVLAAKAVPGLDQANVSVMLVPVRDTVTVPLLDSAPAGGSRWFAALTGVLVVLLLAAGGALGWLWLRMKQAGVSLRPGAKANGADRSNEAPKS